MGNALTAPRVDYWIRVLSSNNSWNESRICCESRKLVREIGEALTRLVPCGDDNRHELWFEVPRGRIEDFGDYQTMKDDGDVDNYEQFERLWKEYYPKETRWYQMTYVHHHDYYGIFLDHEIIASFCEKDSPNGWIEDSSELFRWLLSSVLGAIQSIEAGTYNDYVNERAAYQQRYGVISERDYWEIYPKHRAGYLKEVGRRNAAKFVRIMQERHNTRWEPVPLQQMTAKEFFEYCKVGYLATNPIKKVYDEKLSGLELYKRHADMRDEGLTEIDQDSPEAFRGWLNDRNRWGGHPWEVCRGGNSTHIDFYVRENRSNLDAVLHPELPPKPDGLVLGVRGTAFGRSAETIRFFLALHKLGLPVEIHDGYEMAKRLVGDINIGIVPQGVFPRYCETCFPGEKILDFINLPYEREEAEKIIAKAHWYPIEPVKLADR